MKHKILFNIIVLSLICLPIFAVQDIFFAKIYPEGHPGELAYTHSNTITDQGDSTIYDHYYHTPDGQLYAHDKVVLVNGKPVFNSLDFPQIEEYSSFTRNGDVAELSFERNGKLRTATRDMKTPLVFAPTQQNAIHDHLDTILKGGSVSFYIFASEVLRLVEMKVTMIDDSAYERDGCVVLIMRPRSIFIDWFVDEVYYVVELETGRIVEMHGFSTLRQKVDDKLEFKDMDFYYEYR